MQLIGATAVPVATLWLAVAAPAHAQTVVTTSGPVPGAQPAQSDEQIDFAADTLEYASETDVVTAIGDVRMVDRKSVV